MGESNDRVDGSGEVGSSDENGPRSIFGRLLNALSPSAGEGAGTEQQPAKQGAGIPGALTGMANLRRMRVDDVAIPKVEISAVPVTISKDELVEVFRQSGFSRLPVFKGTLDSPMGLVHLKDLALQYGFGTGNGRFSLRRMLRPLLYVPPSMGIGVLLQKMQTERIHMALVIDEYGGVDGLVTIEDLIEQVIGEIEDEHDEEEGGTFKKEKPGTWVALARTDLAEFEQATGFSLSDPDREDEIDTLGGLVFVLAGRVPARGQVIPHPSGAEFEVIDADPRRVKRLRVRLPVAPDATSEDDADGDTRAADYTGK